MTRMAKASSREGGLAGHDTELEAIRAVMAALEPLNDQERSRVLEYVLKRLQMATVRTPIASREIAPSVSPSPTSVSITDIRSLKEEKRPRSANEMAALVAYYVAELAPEGERSSTINAETLRRYFKMAGFRLPENPQYTLPNAAAAGYVENVSRGEYRLNPVGYNLVVHALPREGLAGGAASGRRAPRKRRAPATRPSRRGRGKKNAGR